MHEGGDEGEGARDLCGGVQGLVGGWKVAVLCDSFNSATSERRPATVAFKSARSSTSLETKGESGSRSEDDAPV